MRRCCENLICCVVVALSAAIIAGTVFVFWVKTHDVLWLLLAAGLILWGFGRHFQPGGIEKGPLRR